MKTTKESLPKEEKLEKTKLNPKSAPEDAKEVSVFQLYRFAGNTEKILLIFGVIFAAGFGVCNPLMGSIMGVTTGDYGESTNEEVLDSVKGHCLIMIYIGVSSFFLGTFTKLIWNFIGNKLGIKIRKMYLEAIMKKDVTWFDLNKPQELPTKIVSLISTYQDGIGDKFGKVVTTIGMAIAGLIIAFVHGWQLALILMALSPITIVSVWLMGLSNVKGMKTIKQGYAKCEDTQKKLCQL